MSDEKSANPLISFQDAEMEMSWTTKYRCAKGHVFEVFSNIVLRGCTMCAAEEIAEKFPMEEVVE